MHTAFSDHKTNRSARAGLPRSLGILLISLLVGASYACATSGVDETAALESASASTGALPEEAASDLAQRWGIEITSIRLTAANHMIDYRYRVLDSDKATNLFKRQIKPHLIHQRSGKVLAVPETAKLGPLRNSNIPQQGRIYWMFFGNAGKLVKAEDKVTVVIGEFRVEDLVVQ